MEFETIEEYLAMVPEDILARLYNLKDSENFKDLAKIFICDFFGINSICEVYDFLEYDLDYVFDGVVH